MNVVHCLSSYATGTATLHFKEHSKVKEYKLLFDFLLLFWESLSPP